LTDPMTRSEALDWGLSELGCGVVVIELSDVQVNNAFDDAVRWWVARRGVKRYAVTAITQGIQEYTMPDDCDEVIDVSFPGVQIDIIAAMDPFAFIDVDMLPVAYQSITGVPGGQFYGTLFQILQHADTARRIIGSEPTWQYQKDTNKLWIFPRQHQSGTALARYASNKLVCDDPTPPNTTPVNDFRRLMFRDRDIILRWYLAELKGKLGRIRAKYSEWPTAGGGKMMDGDSLLGEAQQDKEMLKEEIMGLSDGVPFLTG